MPVTVVVGGQFGSEGKGKVAHFFARQRKATLALRVGGTNSGHTVIGPTGTPCVFRMLPTAALLPDPICALGAGTYIDPELLFQEMKVARLDPARLVIDRNAFVIAEEHKRLECEWALSARIGSTQSGTGAAVADRIMRRSNKYLAVNDERLRPFVSRESTALIARSRLKRGEHVIVEGTQGFGLSVFHSEHYPMATSRDTTASAFLSEAGLSPFDAEDVVLVIRAHPIRVAGNSGPLPTEIDWNIVTQESGSITPISERTSVTKQLRRVGRFDASIVRQAIAVNRPTTIVLNHVDYLDRTMAQRGTLETMAVNFVHWVEEQIGQTVNYIGLGPAKLALRQDFICEKVRA